MPHACIRTYQCRPGHCAKVTAKALSPAVQLINVTSWVIQNTYILARDCSWFDGFVVINGARDADM